MAAGVANEVEPLRHTKRDAAVPARAQQAVAQHATDTEKNRQKDMRAKRKAIVKKREADLKKVVEDIEAGTIETYEYRPPTPLGDETFDTLIEEDSLVLYYTYLILSRDGKDLRGKGLSSVELEEYYNDPDASASELGDDAAGDVNPTTNNSNERSNYPGITISADTYTVEKTQDKSTDSAEPATPAPALVPLPSDPPTAPTSPETRDSAVVNTPLSRSRIAVLNGAQPLCRTDSSTVATRGWQRFVDEGAA